MATYVKSATVTKLEETVGKGVQVEVLFSGKPEEEHFQAFKQMLEKLNANPELEGISPKVVTQSVTTLDGLPVWKFVVTSHEPTAQKILKIANAIRESIQEYFPVCLSENRPKRRRRKKPRASAIAA